ncbi:MAG TPA: alpha/beta fold hydrolase [Thermoanaerobaculia bacterium]|nr:alpha/beta fold hydrolase [Thermoanaerobaculia bacterium]
MTRPRDAAAAAPEPTRSGHLERGPHRIWWEYFGDGDREAVVLLNGLAMHTRAWYGFLDELRPDFDVLLYDYLGQGQSSCPDAPYSIPGFGDDLAAILDHLGIERVHTLGISYGGFIALDFGRRHQQRLLTQTLSGLSHERQFAMYQQLSLRFYRDGADAFELYTHYLYEKIFGEPFLRATDPALLETMRQRFHERYRDRVYCLVRLTEAQDPFFAALDDNLDGYRAVRAPTLLLAGSQDRAIPPWQQRRICDVLPDVRFALLEGAGHVVYLEQRQAFFGILRAFLRARCTDFALPPPSAALPAASPSPSTGDLASRR